MTVNAETIVILIGIPKKGEIKQIEEGWDPQWGESRRNQWRDIWSKKKLEVFFTGKLSVFLSPKRKAAVWLFSSPTRWSLLVFFSLPISPVKVLSTSLPCQLSDERLFPPAYDCKFRAMWNSSYLSIYPSIRLPMSGLLCSKLFNINMFRFLAVAAIWSIMKEWS